MKLIITAQDLSAITFGFADAGGVTQEKTVQTSPEGYLAALNQALQDWSVATADVEAVIVVTGPGSFTASRVSTTIANGLGFARGIPVIGIENPEHLPLRDLDLSAGGMATSHVTPTYDRDAQITMSKKAWG